MNGKSPSSVEAGGLPETPERRHETAILGFWTFLASEVLFFGVLFGAFTAYRSIYAAEFRAAATHLAWLSGAVNTAILLTSSLTVALADHAVENPRFRVGTRVLLGATALLGACFVGIKLWEYGVHIQEGLLPGEHFSYSGPYGRAVELFYLFYFIMTGLHALHLAVGVGIMAVLALRERTSTTGVRIAGLYWHFVDVVWVFLFPLLYLL